MSLSGSRSRSPKEKGNKSDEDFKQSVWADFETKLDAKNEIVFKALKDEVRTVVGTLVNREIERVETKIDANQKANETSMVIL